MPKKEIKRPKNNNDTNEILLAINENIGLATLEVAVELKKIRENGEDILSELKKRRK